MTKFLPISYKLFVSICILALFFLQILWIESIPPALFIDELNLAVPAAELALGEKSIPIAEFGWYGTPGLFFHYLAFYFKVFGFNTLAIKLAWLVPGFISLIFVYIFAKSFFQSRYVAVMSLLLYGMNTIVVNIGRWGHGPVIISTLQLICLTFFWKASQTKSDSLRIIYFLLSGMSAGVSMYMYVGARSFVLSLILLIIWYAFSSKISVKRKIFHTGFFVAIVVAIVFPQIHFATKNPSEFLWRIKEVSIIRSERSFSDNSQSLFNNIVLYGKTLVDEIDTNLRHNPLQTPLFPYFLGLSIPIGLAILFVHKKKFTKAVFFSFILFGTLSGAVLSAEAPSYFRMYGAIPFLTMLMVVPIFTLVKSKRLQTIQTPTQIFSWLILIIMLFFPLKQYYFVMLDPPIHIRDAFTYSEEVVAKTLTSYVKTSKPVYISKDYLYSSTLFFALPAKAQQKYLLFDIDDVLTLEEDAVLVLEPSALSLQDFLKDYFSFSRVYEIETGAAPQPFVLELSPTRSIPDQLGLALACEQNEAKFIEGVSLGVYHSMAKFPEGPSTCVWRGLFTPSEMDTYSFLGKADDSIGMKLYASLDQPIITQEPTDYWEKTVLLLAQPYTIEITYENTGGARNAQLLWKPPGQRDYSVISPTAFSRENNNKE